MAPKILDLHSAARTLRRVGPRIHTPPPAVPRRPAPLKARRRRFRALIALAGFVGVILVAYGIHWISFRPGIRVQGIEIHGSTYQPTGSVSDYVRSKLATTPYSFVANDSIFMYPKNEIRAGILYSFPRLKTARVSRNSIFGTTLIVEVTERTAYGHWCSTVIAPGETKCYVFDETGYIYADAPSTPTRPVVSYTFSGGVSGIDPIGAVFLEEHLHGLLALLERLSGLGYVPVAARIDDEKDFIILLQSGYSIKASFGQSIDTLIHNLQLVSVSDSIRGKEGNLEYIDLRFGNRAYFKFRSSEANPATTTSQ